MTEEELLDCVMELDTILSQAESFLSDREYKIALHKIREARAAIEDLREDDESNIDSSEKIGMDVMNNLK
jgi:uncharacterized protein YbcI